MEWTDQAIVLSAIKHGEGHAVLDVLTQTKGRAKGYVRGGSGAECLDHFARRNFTRTRGLPGNP